VWNGHVVRTPATVIEYTTRVVGEVLIDIDGDDDDLLPQTNVTVTVATASSPDTLSIPRDALYSEGGKTFVYKLVKNELVKTPVTTGIKTLTQVSILSGLNEGDVVATGTGTGQPLQVDVPVKQVQ
jgi:HlyD family secretion protein